ncbi:carboxypeptidase-like regulatory domain-containing protein [Hymenobacter sp. BT186]|uniref:Carboxypeptidase-like regulatory domain-containing protein n=1 Tax=Hymenobacter telluris TaxID=2816474 RepID=A0A939EYF5_9BACT|nr:carboxypeptidase-like regulatory domain-containing protein [Hymenobacter telluris]MBO0358897.1 carboxypeptidase-like regulatory domain-containing protein [Hymenobacter telluris]MBW3374923.1 carboxypeptidase-like regulatory domain-containing protein [Hymenobacter norwichensis]
MFSSPSVIRFSLFRSSLTAGLFLLALLALPFGAAAQFSVRGTVVDKETKEPLPFVSIQVVGTTNGTASNVNGEFTLVLKDLPRTLVFSELGHLRDTLRVTQATYNTPLQVAMAPASVVLPEVKVNSYPFQLVEKAFRQLQSSYSRKFYGKAYYRQLTRISNEPTELQEVVWDVKSNPARIEGTAIAQGRYAAKQAATAFSNFSIYTRSYGLYDVNADSTKSLALLSPNTVKNYLLELKGLLDQDSSTIAEISFETRPEIKYRAEGTIWINIETNKIVRYKMTQPNFTAKSSNPNQKFKNPKLSVDMVFKPSDDAPVSPLDHMQVDLTADLVTGTKSGTVPLSVNSFTYFYDTSTTPTKIAYARPSVDDRDLETIKATKYDPEFWANNPVVQRTPVEDEVVASFEKKGAFGTMVKKAEPKADVIIRNGKIE